MMQPSPQDAVTLGQQLASLNTAISQLVQFTSHLSQGAMSAYAIQWAKKQPWFAPLWNAFEDRGRVVIGMIIAGFGAAGISYTFSHPDATTFGITFTNVTLLTFGKFIWSVLQSWTAQQTTYAIAIKAKPITGAPAPAPPVPVVPVAPAGGQ